MKSSVSRGWEQPASTLALLQAVLRASVTVLGGTAVAGGIVLLNGPALQQAGWAVLAGGILFCLSLFAHEYAHWRVLQRYSVATSIVQYGMQLRLIHQRLPRQGERACALAGPAAGAALCAITACIAFALNFVAVGAVAGLLLLFHGCSLLPGQCDGAALYQSYLKGTKHDNNS